MRTGLTGKPGEEVDEETHCAQDAQYETKAKTARPSALSHQKYHRRCAPSDEAVEALLPGKAEGRERRISFPERGLRDEAARGLDVEPALGCHVDVGR
jgi:hypothetical protein